MLNRNFKAKYINKVWCNQITYIWTNEGLLTTSDPIIIIIYLLIIKNDLQLCNKHKCSLYLSNSISLKFKLNIIQGKRYDFYVENN